MYQAILVDAYNLLHRAIHTASVVLVDLPGPNGQTLRNMDVGGALQFVRLVLSHVENRATARPFVCVCWEGGERRIRRERWPHYQTKRPAPSEALRLQEEVARSVLARVGVSQASAPGWEADDVIGTLAGRLAPRTVGIVSSDHDLHQLVSERVHVLDANTRNGKLPDGIWTLDLVREHWGVEPRRIPEVKALAGDTSDGIPGATGIGEKGARGLMTATDLPTLLERVKGHMAADNGAVLEFEGPEGLARLPWKKCRQLAAEEEQIRLFFDLCSINCDAPISFVRRYHEDPSAVFKRFRFASLLSPSSMATVRRITVR
jgi:DNA polymerase-1